MSASLVGSEMCIRDSGWSKSGEVLNGRFLSPSFRASLGLRRDLRIPTEAVSYTHLTLPTICSV
eukprot:6442633-Alexandrium_andersonii.AAC.1